MEQWLQNCNRGGESREKSFACKTMIPPRNPQNEHHENHQKRMSKTRCRSKSIAEPYEKKEYFVFTFS